MYVISQHTTPHALFQNYFKCKSTSSQKRNFI